MNTKQNTHAELLKMSAQDLFSYLRNGFAIGSLDNSAEKQTNCSDTVELLSERLNEDEQELFSAKMRIGTLEDDNQRLKVVARLLQVFLTDGTLQSMILADRQLLELAIHNLQKPL